MANGLGVSVAKVGDGKWRVRWRETVEQDGVTRRVQREKVVPDEETAINLQLNILQTVKAGRVWEPPVRHVQTPEVTTVDDVAAGWLRARAARGMSKRTVQGNGLDVKCILAGLRELHGLEADTAIPGEVLTRAAVVSLTGLLRSQGKADGTIYGTIGTMLRMWLWASDDPVTYPGLANPPRDTQSAKPRPPVYESPEAPTIDEVDAVIRRVAAMPRTGNVALPVAVIARWTGLRVSSILPIRPSDVNLSACTLLVTTDKVRGARRTIPIATGLRDYLVGLVADAQASGREWLLKRSRHVRNPLAGSPSETIGDAWEAATVAGEVRREVWQPPTRKVARPDHAMRAAFQDALVRAGVRDEVIDLLVGHAGKTTRAKHYVSADARMEAMREAVAKLPPLVLKVEERPSNVVPIQW